jgi:hypothetical protein
MVPMLKSEGPGRSRCGYGSGVVDLTHMRAQTLSQAQRCTDAVAVAGAVAHKITQTSKRARTHAQTRAHTHAQRTHARAHTQCSTHRCAHTQCTTRICTHKQCSTHRCTQTHTHRKRCIRPSAQPSRHAIAAVYHTHALERSDRCATFIDRIIGKTRWASPAGPAQDAQALGSKQSHDPSRHRRVTNGT